MKKSGILMITAVFILLFGQGLFNSSLASKAKDPGLISPSKATDPNRPDRTTTTTTIVGQSHFQSCEAMAAEVAKEEACCEAESSGETTCEAAHATNTTQALHVTISTCAMTCTCIHIDSEGNMSTDTAAEERVTTNCNYE